MISLNNYILVYKLLDYKLRLFSSVGGDAGRQDNDKCPSMNDNTRGYVWVCMFG